MARAGKRTAKKRSQKLKLQGANTGTNRRSYGKKKINQWINI